MHDLFPSEPLNNSSILRPSFQKLKIHFGSQSWGRTEWIGRLYPEDSKEKQFLANYVQHFNAIELNATHYQIYSASEIKNWADRANGRDFIFCPKVPQSISHYSSFIDIEDKTNAFLDGIYAFGAHLGPIFLQVSDRFSPKRRQGLFDYLVSLPADLQLFLEVRNPEWFEEPAYQETLNFLRVNKIGLIISDSPKTGDCPKSPLMLDLTIPKCFIRYYPSGDYSRLDKWYNKIEEWGAKGLTDAYFFVHSAGDANQQLEELLYFKSLVEKV